MATIVNNPPPAPERESNGLGTILGAVLILVVAYFLVVYGLPALRGAASPQINVPSKIDVNINQPKK